MAGILVHPPSRDRIKAITRFLDPGLTGIFGLDDRLGRRQHGPVEDRLPSGRPQYRLGHGWAGCRSRWCKAFDWHGARVVIKASGSDTAGQLAVMERTYPAGLSVPEHHHEGEDELFYLLDGELEGFCGEDRWTATPGSFVLVPRDQPHGFVVSSATAARALVIVGPPRLDQQVAATGIPVGESGISE